MRMSSCYISMSFLATILLATFYHANAAKSCLPPESDIIDLDVATSEKTFETMLQRTIDFLKLYGAYWEYCLAFDENHQNAHPERLEATKNKYLTKWDPLAIAGAHNSSDENYLSSYANDEKTRILSMARNFLDDCIDPLLLQLPEEWIDMPYIKSKYEEQINKHIIASKIKPKLTCTIKKGSGMKTQTLQMLDTKATEFLKITKDLIQAFRTYPEPGVLKKKLVASIRSSLNEAMPHKKTLENQHFIPAAAEPTKSFVPNLDQKSGYITSKNIGYAIIGTLSLTALLIMIKKIAGQHQKIVEQNTTNNKTDEQEVSDVGMDERSAQI